AVARCVTSLPHVKEIVAAGRVRCVNRAVVTVTVGMIRPIDNFLENADGQLLRVVLDLKDVGLAQLSYTLDFGLVELGMENNIGKQIERGIHVRFQGADIDDRIVTNGKRPK